MISDRRFSALVVAGISAAVSFLWLWPIWDSNQSPKSKDGNQRKASPSTPSEQVASSPKDDSEPKSAKEEMTSAVMNLWRKIVSATRDTRQHENLTKINFDQWNLALDKYGVVCEPGLSRTVFQSMSSSIKKKEVSMSEFAAHTERMLSDEITFKHHALMQSQQLLEIRRSADAANLFAIVLLSKILYALLNDEHLNVEALLKETVDVTSDANVHDLLSRLDDSDWENRVMILKHLHDSLQNDRLIFSSREESDSDDSTSCCSRNGGGELSPMNLLRAWMDQFSDQRSQLVRYVLETFPDIVACVMENGYLDAIDFRSVFEALFVPIRAKRSTRIQEWAHVCSEKLVQVILAALENDTSPRDFHRFLDDDTEEENVIMISCGDDDGMISCGSPVAELVDIFCANIAKNGKYERVRERCVSYLKLVIEFYFSNGDMEFLLDDELIVNRIVHSLNLTLLDKKSEVRSQAFALMKRLSEMNLSIVRECVLSKIDDKARDRYERSNGSSKKKRRSVRRRVGGTSIAQYRRRMQTGTNLSEESVGEDVVVA